MLIVMPTTGPRKLLFVMLKFCMTGMTGLVIDFSITYLLKEDLSVNPYLSNAMGFVAAATSNFYINKKWTFKDKSSKMLHQYLLFVSISAIGLLLNTAFLYLFFQYMAISFYISKVLSVIVVFAWNFTANSLFTFKYGGIRSGYRTSSHND